jgi:ribosomal protein S27E
MPVNLEYRSCKKCGSVLHEPVRIRGLLGKVWPGWKCLICGRTMKGF